MKGRIRMLQREAAQRRMMADVPQADVIVTNPEHFSVALRYKQNQDKAPIVVAKGVDHMAMKIREIARANDIYIVPAPPLARALYHTTELEQQILTVCLRQLHKCLHMFSSLNSTENEVVSDQNCKILICRSHLIYVIRSIA